jgi:hypothetical protein
MKTKTLLPLLLILALAGCKKSKKSEPEPEPPAVASTMVSQWTWKEFSYSDTITDPGNPFPATAGKGNLKFEGDGTYICNNDFTRIGTPDFSKADNGTYTSGNQGDSITITSKVSGYKVRAKVLKLSSSELWFRYKVYYGTYYEVHFAK